MIKMPEVNSWKNPHDRKLGDKILPVKRLVKRRCAQTLVNPDSTNCIGESVENEGVILTGFQFTLLPFKQVLVL